MYTIGENCDLILIHEDVNGGDPYGFVISPDPSKSGSSISIQRSLDDDDAVQIYLFATILLADELHNPDGSEHTDSRQTMYDMLLNYLEKIEGLSIGTVMGTYLGLGQIGHATTELHMVHASYISLKFGNVSTYHQPISSDLFFGSLWQDTPPDDDAFTWDTSVWR
ncbi:MAG: hypothetical protein MUO76_23910 [Anaerolineaceae bacterium]|nr:hypothetical protein [Anaerolineaceae bacterium]